MNYKDVVNRIQTIVEDHKMLVDFGYGQVSDIKTRSTGTEGEPDGADYPYLFLNPTQHVRTQQQITYNFNMIVMDMAREEEAHEYQNFLNIQSDCIQYIDDIVARLYYFYKDKPEVSMDLNYTPFYERFQDDLAGATATLSITVPNSINECIAPFAVPVLRNYNTLSCGILPLTTTHSWTSFEPLVAGSVFKDDFDTCWSITDETLDAPIAAIAEFFTDCDTCEASIIPPPELVLSVESTLDQLFKPDLEQSPLRFEDIILDSQGPWVAPTYTGWRNPSFNFYKPSTAGTWRFVLTGEVTLVTDQGDWPDSPDVILRLDGTEPQTAPTTTTWPSTQPAIGVATPFECVWEGFSYIPDEPGNQNDDYLMWNWIDDPQVEDEFKILAGATLKGYFTA